MKNEYTNFTDSLEEIILEYEDRDEHLQIARQSLTQVKNRVCDETMYLGVIGAFSSGKSTFINSMIRKNLLPTDAVQGTTVSATILKKSDINDLEVVYSDGTEKKYSSDSVYFSEKYSLLATTKKMSFWRRLICWFMGLFGLNVEKGNELNQIRELFLKLISEEDNAKDVERVILHINNENIKFNIGLVDTPGTESLNERHNKVTKNAIDNICDALVIIIPYDEPVSEELIRYINANVKEYIDNCIFVVTKVELLDDLDELPRLLKVIKKRLTNGLEIDNPIVIPMPTLLYLKNADLDTDIKLLDDLPEERKDYLLGIYEQGLQEIYAILVDNRERYIKNKLIAICEQISDSLLKFLKSRVDCIEEHEKKLLKDLVIDMQEYSDKVVSIIEDNEKCFRDVTSKNTILISDAFESFENSITDKINSRSEIDSIVDVIMGITEIKAADDVKRVYQDCISQMKKVEKEIYHRIEEEFIYEYRKCGDLRSLAYSNYPFDSDDIDSLVSSFKEDFRTLRDGVANTVKSKKGGLVGKVKMLFAKNVQKEKGYAIEKMLSFLDEQRQQTIISFGSIEDKLVSTAKEHVNTNFLSLLSENQQVIENYCGTIERSIGANKTQLMKTSEHIEKVNMYLYTLKER